MHFVNADDGTSASVLHVDIRPRAMTVARTFRFQTAENEFFKERLPPPPGVATRDASGRGCLAVRASDPAVAAAVVTTESEEDGEVDEVALRYKCGEGSVAFYVCVYADSFLGKLAAVWRVFVHATPKVDVSSLVGQSSHASVVVQGGVATRRVAAFCSHPDELQVSPDRLTLPPGALTELQLAFRPLIPGRLDVAGAPRRPGEGRAGALAVGRHGREGAGGEQDVRRRRRARSSSAQEDHVHQPVRETEDVSPAMHAPSAAALQAGQPATCPRVGRGRWD